MQISNLSISYILKQLQGGAGASSTSAADTGQNSPIDTSGADPSSSSSSSATTLKASDLSSSQFASDTLSSLLSAQTSPSSDLASKLIGSLDTDGDGSLSQDEVANAVGASSTDISSKFAKLDSNGDGKLSQGELSSALDSAVNSAGGPPQGGPPPGVHHGHHHHGGMAKQEASDLVSQLDTNGDGTVSLDELNAGSAAATSSTSTSSSTDASTSTGTTTADATSTTGATTTSTASTDMSKTFASVDANGDGQLSLNELTKALAQAMAQQHQYAKPFWENASSASSTTGSTQSVTA